MYSELVKEFFAKFKPTVKMTKLIREEFNEWFDEFDADVYNEEKEFKELCDFVYVIYGAAEQLNWVIEPSDTDVHHILTEIPPNNLYTLIVAAYSEWICTKNRMWLENLISGLFAYADSKEWDLAKGFKLVHESNMSKLGLDGNPVYREDGKVLKGPNYRPANLAKLIVKNKASKKKIRKADTIKF